MKTKISINLETIPSLGDLLSDSSIANIIKAVTRDEGERLTPDDIIGFLNVNRAIYYPSINKYCSRSNGHFLSISADDGITYPLTLEWREVHELNETEADLINQTNLS